LPTDLWIEVLSHCTQKELLVCSQVAQFLNELANSQCLWKTFCKTDWGVSDVTPWKGFDHFKDLYKRLRLLTPLCGLWRASLIPCGGVLFIYMDKDNGLLVGVSLTLNQRGKEQYTSVFHLYVQPPSCDEPYTLHVSKNVPHSRSTSFLQNIVDYFNGTLTISPEATHDEPTGWQKGYIKQTTKGRISIYPWGTDYRRVRCLYTKPGKPYPPAISKVTGLWKGNYGSHGWEIIHVSVENDLISALKVTGDPNVPAGEVTWRARTSHPIVSENGQLNDTFGEESGDPERTHLGYSFAGEGRTARVGFVTPEWNTGFLTLFSPSKINFAWEPHNFGITYRRVESSSEFVDCNIIAN